MFAATLSAPSPIAGESTPTDRHLFGDLFATDGPLVVTGNLTVDGTVRAGSVIRAFGKILIGHDVRAARVATCNDLDVPDGIIVGGRASAQCALTCRVAGDEDSTPTELAIGFNDLFLDAAEECVAWIEKTLRITGKVKSTLEPLQLARDLTASQKEQITEQLFRGADATKRASTAMLRLKSLFGGLECKSNPSLTVTGLLRPGVTVCFPGATCVIRTPLQGPIKLFAVHSGEHTVIRAADLQTNASHAMECSSQMSRVDSIRGHLEKLGQN